MNKIEASVGHICAYHNKEMSIQICPDANAYIKRRMNWDVVIAINGINR